MSDATAMPEPITTGVSVPAEEPPQYPTDAAQEHLYFTLLDSIGQVDRFGGHDTVTEGDLADCLRVIRDAKRELAQKEREVENRLGGMMPRRKMTISGVGTIEASPRKSRKDWDHTRLQSAVADSLIVDEQTGEILTETPVEKIVAVYGSRGRKGDQPPYMPGYNASLTELRRRGIKPEKFCDETNEGGYTIKLTTT